MLKRQRRFTTCAFAAFREATFSTSSRLYSMKAAMPASSTLGAELRASFLISALTSGGMP